MIGSGLSREGETIKRVGVEVVACSGIGPVRVNDVAGGYHVPWREACSCEPHKRMARMPGAIRRGRPERLARDVAATGGLD